MNNIIGAENQMQNQGRRPAGGGGDDDNNHSPPPHHKCPRCDSHNTKFCYYNNYTLSQPRYYCKACRRYWTQGGTLRNVPIGGGCRKNKLGTIRVPPPSVPNLGAHLSPVVRHLNATAVIPPPPQMGSSFYGGGSFMSPLAPMQPLPAGQGAVAGMMNLGGGGPFGGNVGLMHGVSLPLNTAHQPPARFFPPQPPSLMSPPPGFSPWGQSFVNSGSSTSSSGGGNDQAGPSSVPYQWGDGHQGFNP